MTAKVQDPGSTIGTLRWSLCMDDDQGHQKRHAILLKLRKENFQHSLWNTPREVTVLIFSR